jgi:putative spermidine/putrescine transport system ATP-binding protein/spermidine/putrescine transport system ATP-binding protein
MPRHEGIPAAGPALLLLRPEAVHPAAGSGPSLPATVEEVVYLGELMATRLALPTGQKIWMRQIASPTPAAVGQTVRIQWEADRIRLLEKDNHTYSSGRPDHDLTP